MNTTFAGARLARDMHNRLPDWMTQPSGVGTYDLVDPSGTWVVHIDQAGAVDLERRGEPAGVLRQPVDPGALAAYLTVVAIRTAVGR